MTGPYPLIGQNKKIIAYKDTCSREFVVVLILSGRKKETQTSINGGLLNNLGYIYIMQSEKCTN